MEYVHSINKITALRNTLQESGGCRKPQTKTTVAEECCDHSFIQAIYIAPLKVRYYSKALPTQHGYCARVSRRSTSGNCEL